MGTRDYSPYSPYSPRKDKDTAKESRNDFLMFLENATQTSQTCNKFQRNIAVIKDKVHYSFRH